MSCNKETSMILVDILPQLRSLSDSINRKRMVLAIILRIFRGYLIFMKDKESISDFQAVAKEIVAISNELNMEDQAYVDESEKELMKYVSNFLITVLKSYFDNNILISCIKSIWGFLVKSNVFYIIVLNISII